MKRKLKFATRADLKATYEKVKEADTILGFTLLDPELLVRLIERDGRVFVHDFTGAEHPLH